MYLRYEWTFKRAEHSCYCSCEGLKYWIRQSVVVFQQAFGFIIPEVILSAIES